MSQDLFFLLIQDTLYTGTEVVLSFCLSSCFPGRPGEYVFRNGFFPFSSPSFAIPTFYSPSLRLGEAR